MNTTGRENITAKKPTASREERLKAALKANMAKRKAQGKARVEQSAPSKPIDHNK